MMLIALAMLVSGIGMIAPASPEASGCVANWTPAEAGNTPLAIIIAAVGLAIAAGIISLTNQTFNIVRTQTNLNLGIFFLTACATPGVLGMQTAGILLCITVLFCLMIMFTIYQRHSATRRIFLVFTLLSAGSTFNYGFAAFIPAFILGCWQMRCLTFRSFLAILIGLITPYWILWGFGIITFEQLQAPTIMLPSADTLRHFSVPQLVAIICFLTVTPVTMLYNLIQVLGRNARTRAFNGIIAGMTFWTCLATAIDFGHAMTYMALLCALAGIQLTIYFTTDAMRRGYIAILLAVVLSLAVYICNLAI